MSAVGLRSWLLPALACAAMLILPGLTWVLTPRPGGYPVAPHTHATAASVNPGSEPFVPQPVQATHVARDPGSASPAEAGPVLGVVLDPDGRPVKGAQVLCADRDPPVTAGTDDDGRFQLPEAAAGCVASAQHPDFIGSDHVTLDAGRTNTLRLDRGGGIEGDVVDERSQPVPSFILAVEAYQGPAMEKAPIGQVKSIQDPRGAFAWDNLVPGRYVLTASADHRPPARSSQIEVEVGRTTSHVRINLPRGATLSGRVLDASTRKPIAGAVLTLDGITTTRAQAIRPARSDEQGAYVLEGAPAGPFSVRVSRDGYRTRTVTGLTTRGAAALQQDIELKPVVDGGPAGEDFAGIGAFLKPAANGVTFARLVPGGPAEQAGVQAGRSPPAHRRRGRLVAVRLRVMQSLRGPEDSRVSVQVERAGRRLDMTLQRRSITF